MQLLLCLLPFPRVHDRETRRECSDRYSKSEGGRRRRWRKRSESLGTGDGCKEEETEEDGGEREGGWRGGRGRGGRGWKWVATGLFSTSRHRREQSVSRVARW